MFHEAEKSLMLFTLQGGSLESLPKDMEQAKKMVNLVIKVDVWIKHLSAGAKNEVRLNRQELLITLPARRVWFFLKQIRNISRSNNPQLDGPEDVIAAGIDSALLTTDYQY